jgi:hypothetical protein
MISTAVSDAEVLTILIATADAGYVYAEVFSQAGINAALVIEAL